MEEERFESKDSSKDLSFSGRTVGGGFPWCLGSRAAEKILTEKICLRHTDLR